MHLLDVSTNSPQDGTPEVGEEGEEMDATNADDEAMMAMMGMSGFGSTKVPLHSSRYCI